MEHKYLVVYGRETYAFRSVEKMTEQEAWNRLQELKSKYPLAAVTRVNW